MLSRSQHGRIFIALLAKTDLIWVILKNVPPQLYSLKGLGVIASGVGEQLQTKKSRLPPMTLGNVKLKVENLLAKQVPSSIVVRDKMGNIV